MTRIMMPVRTGSASLTDSWLERSIVSKESPKESVEQGSLKCKGAGALNEFMLLFGSPGKGEESRCEEGKADREYPCISINYDLADGVGGGRRGSVHSAIQNRN